MRGAIELVVEETEKSARSLEEGKPEAVGPLGICDSALLVFEDIKFRVPNLEGGKTEILKGISGACRPGRLMALMGASGAGKTSLTDILAGQTRAGVSGSVTLNGAPFDAQQFQRDCCYVPQRDVLLATATVKEAVETSALLRLPRSMPRAEKDQRVAVILKQLELEKCANTLVGDDGENKKGISGGERRRLSVAIALVTDPKIIMLDEPTSGLDSETATALVKCLKGLARANRTVVCSIHQPNSHIMECFDDLLLLSNGHTAYYGPWHKSVDYFQSQDFICPVYTNPSDYYLTITKEAGPKLTQAWSKTAKAFLPEVLPGGFSGSGSFQKPASASPARGWFSSFGSPSASPRKTPRRNLTFVEDDFIKVGIPEMEEDVEMGFTKDAPPEFYQFTASSGGVYPPASPYPPPSPGGLSVRSVADSYVSCKVAPIQPKPESNWLFHMRVLIVRFARTWYRTPHMLGGFLIQYVFAGLFMGLMYIQLGTERASSIFDRQASLFLVLVMLAYTPSSTSSTVWESERLLLRREANSGAYTISTFFAAKTAVTFPVQAIICFLYCVLFYFITGYQANAEKFAIFVTVCILVQLISETIGGICAILTKTATVGIMVSSTFLTVMLAFSGFLISHTPIFFQWISQISFVTYAYSAIYQNEFVGLQMRFSLPGDGPGTPTAAGLSLSLGNSDYRCLPTGGRSSSRGPHGNNTTIGEDVAILFGVLVGLRVLHCLLLHAAYRLKKL